MKILQKGNPYFDRPWVGAHVSCTRCGAKFELEENDIVRETESQLYSGYYDVDCPTCDRTCTFGTKPTSTGPIDH